METNMINIVPLFTNNVQFVVSEILRQKEEAGLTKFALSLSYHPQGTPARNLIPKYCNAVKQVVSMLDGKGIELGALIQSTQGHGWNGKVPLTEEPWQQIIMSDGEKSPRMCPMDPGFRAYVSEAIRETVKAGVTFLLVDDDFGMRVNECLCPLHLKRISQELGKEISLEYAQKIVKRPWNDPEFMTIARLRYELAIEFAKDIRAAIDSVNPDIRCGLCTPWAGYGFVGDSAITLAGKTKPFIRINNAIYGMCNILHFIYLFQGTHRVKYQAPGVTEFIDEADTFPQNYYSESAMAFHAHIVNALLCGLQGCKLWTAEFNNPVDLKQQKRYENYLLKYKKYYNTLLNTVNGIQWLGASGQLFRPLYANHTGLCAGALNTQDWCTDSLANFAFPVRYVEAGEGGVYSITAKDVAHLDDEKLKKLLAGNLLIDSTAAKALTKRGFESLMGVRATDGDDKFSFELEKDPETQLTCGFMWEPLAAELEILSPEAKEITKLMNGSIRNGVSAYKAPGMVFYTNSLGGRIVVTAYSPEMPFYKTIRYPRRMWLKKALDFLAGGFFEMSIENADQQVLIRHGKCVDGTELVSVQSLALDVLPQLDFRLKRTPKSIEKLCPDGTWTAVEFKRTDDEIISVMEELPCCMPAVYRFIF